MRIAWIGTAAVMAALTAVGCSDSTGNANDAGSGGGGDTGTVTDAGGGGGDACGTRRIAERQPIYGECRNNADCDEGLTCSTEAEQGFPGGQCNRSCTRDDDCVLYPRNGSPPVDGYCAPADMMGRRTCRRVCVNGADCEREGYTCTTLNARTINEVKVCIPICSEATCRDCTTCNPDTGLCRPPGAPAAMGRAVGETCRASTDPMATAATRCRSDLCNAESLPDSMGRPTYTGWNGGSCIARCILPEGYNPATYWDGEALPRGTCPQGALCLPNGSQAEGDLGICLDECTQDSDCRRNQGYFCRKSFQVSTTRTVRFTNGFCVPVNCRATGMSCPTGFTCRAASTTSGTCIPATMQ